ncbi:hypothetical protein [Kitasatospora sp. NPDC094015]|uniref:hypothetical protein n=1 Tax=Kitasatospora sp. NPDC094015 TaxID=3155205 RepID=UPI0033332A75
MTTILERAGRDRLAAALDRLPTTPEEGGASVPVDAAALEAVVAVLGQYAAQFADEPLGRAVGTLAGRLRLRVPMTALLRLDKELDPGTVDLT